jgi:hypothetical protein
MTEAEEMILRNQVAMMDVLAQVPEASSKAVGRMNHLRELTRERIDAVARAREAFKK